MEQKYCRNCVYCRSSSLSNNGVYDICVAPGTENRINPVTGGIIPSYCMDQRSVPGSCGPGGEKFIERDKGYSKRPWWTWWNR